MFPAYTAKVRCKPVVSKQAYFVTCLLTFHPTVIISTVQIPLPPLLLFLIISSLIIMYLNQSWSDYNVILRNTLNNG